MNLVEERSEKPSEDKIVSGEILDIASRLPTELVQHIFSYLSPDELARCCLVSKCWRNVAFNLNVLWKRFCFEEGHCELPAQFSAGGNVSKWAVFYSLCRRQILTNWLHNNPHKYIHGSTVDSLYYTDGSVLVNCCLDPSNCLEIYDIISQFKYLHSIPVEPIVNNVIIRGKFIVAVHSLKVLSIYLLEKSFYTLKGLIYVHGSSLIYDENSSVTQIIDSASSLSKITGYRKTNIIIFCNSKLYNFSLDKNKLIFSFDCPNVLWSIVDSHNLLIKSKDLCFYKQDGSKVTFREPGRAGNTFYETSRDCNKNILATLDNSVKGRAFLTVWKSHTGEVIHKDDIFDSCEMIITSSTSDVLVYTLKCNQPTFVCVDLRTYPYKSVKYTPFEYGYLLHLHFIRSDLLAISHSIWGSGNISLLNLKSGKLIHSTMIHESSLLHFSNKVIVAERVRSGAGIVVLNYFNFGVHYSDGEVEQLIRHEGFPGFA